MVGGVVSTTCTVRVQLALLPLWSVAVKVTGVSPSGKHDPCGRLVVGLGSHTSVAENEPSHATTAASIAGTPPRLGSQWESHCSVRSAGQLTVGGVVSTTSTVAEQVEVFPLKFLAVNVTVVTPSGKHPGALFVTVGEGSQASVAEAPARKAAIWGSEAGVPPDWLHSTVMPFGHVTVGAVWSLNPQPLLRAK